MSPSPALSVVILAGGASRRMGRDKAGLEVDGERLVDRAARLAGALTDDVIVVSGPRRDLQPTGAREVTDRGRGPLDGLAAGLAAAGGEAAGVLAVDMPRPCTALLRALATLLGGHDAAVPVVEGRLQPLHAVWATRLAPALERLLEAGERSPTAALHTLEVVRAGPEVWRRHDPAAAFAENWNRPGDLPGRTAPGDARP